ncbi:TPA: DUF551 domain-containing protein [Klebsiella pneumoniae]|nr:DUF551 domain-containing protein [Klebsiella pneumoniae]WEI85151.1 DUF551 domain-containing protein [Klebsiella pneumoniae]
MRKGPDMPPAQPVADSEPVAWTWQHLKQWYVTNDEERARELAWDGVKVEQLYRHAQPVPVASADLLHTAASAIEDLLEHTDPNTSYYSGVWADVPGKLRAAAPQSPGSEPATVPGKWIPVSERMPERGDWLVTDGCDFDVQLFNGEQFIPGFVWEDKITHWMPLPAAPQEVKGE